MRVMVVLLLVLSSHEAVAQDFNRLTTLANATLAGIGVDEAVPGFEIQLMQDGQVLYHRAFGSWTLGQPAKVDSSTKTLSGALVMSLVDSGESGFSLDSRLADFLPSFDKPGYRDITVRQAFSHSSGLPAEDVGGAVLLAPNITLNQAANVIAQMPLEHGPPGSTFGYGGLSMQATGAAMEVAAGMPYIDLFDERIATPMQLAETRFYIASDANPRVAGGIESTAADFGRVMDMLLNDGVDRTTGQRILSVASAREMLTRQTSDAQPIAASPVENNRYGIGVWLDQLDRFGPPANAMAGGARGFHSWIDASEGLVFTFSTDTTRFANLHDMASRMHAAVLADLVPEPGAAVLLTLGFLSILQRWRFQSAV
ncbi:D-alanyl-D-alanine-carboxypeptidase/endopeptidase AmpH precursor [Posidoniimonas polymericola]|uniref:D-alanyl-D-alanine-carboxypeptidase/endopeptidase AmpH n=1 Tax=Posidoniimonas polymericola TaxID=2528002 RepID=A0A5C5YSH8_9BACT|nr:serine hydrolase domain-containing protein [Posidoniimonas polymericola]TWT77909.1 D-alanyl-D-alanine-carboxypeptidase/endopeptidase AmpH precursor [Posidoniimonas polymericola]